MITSKNLCKISQCILYIIFLSSEFIGVGLVTFVDLVFVKFFTFADTLSAALILPSHKATGSSILLAKYSPFSQTHGLWITWIVYYHMDYVLLDFCTHTDIYNYSTFDLIYIFVLSNLY